MLKAGGSVEEYEAKANSVKARLREELQCYLPACVLTITVKAGSVILTVVATDTTGAASQVESAAVALQTKDLDDMSSALGITIEEKPSAPSVTDVQVQVTRLAPSPPRPPLPGIGEEDAGVSGASQDAGPGLAIGLALGGCLLVAVLAAAIFFWLRKRRTKPPSSSASTTAPRQVEVIVTQPASTQPETQQPTAAPESLAAVLAACGLQHHEKTFQAEGYTLETLLKSIKQGDAAAKSDLSELKLSLGERRRLINHMKARQV